jgi:YD repeat-containing protein
VTYAYDTLNRLISAQGGVSFGQSGTNWGQGFQYDPFGNLSAKTVLAGSAPTWSAVPDVTTNRVGATDANGNSSAYGWDAENRLVASVAPPAASYTRYAYDGQNKQIWSCTWNTASNLCTTDNGYSFYSPAGKLLGTYTITFTPYYYANNQKVPDSLTITNGTPLAYFGSRRLWVPDRVGSQGRFFPYGEDRTGMNYPQSGQYAFATYLDNGSGAVLCGSEVVCGGAGKVFIAGPVLVKRWPGRSAELESILLHFQTIPSTLLILTAFTRARPIMVCHPILEARHCPQSAWRRFNPNTRHILRR